MVYQIVYYVSPARIVPQKHKPMLYSIKVNNKWGMKHLSKVMGSIPYSDRKIKIIIDASEKPFYPPSSIEDNRLVKDEVLEDVRKLLRYGISSTVNISVV